MEQHEEAYLVPIRSFTCVYISKDIVQPFAYSFCIGTTRHQVLSINLKLLPPLAVYQFDRLPTTACWVAELLKYIFNPLPGQQTVEELYWQSRTVLILIFHATKMWHIEEKILTINKSSTLIIRNNKK